MYQRMFAEAIRTSIHADLETFNSLVTVKYPKASMSARLPYKSGMSRWVAIKANSHPGCAMHCYYASAGHVNPRALEQSGAAAHTQPALNMS